MQGMTRGGLGAAAFSKQQLCRTDKSLCFLVNLFLDEFVIFVIINLILCERNETHGF